ncbi:hypothetical protein H8K38_13240 [Undibacterium sp. FT79W]|uniref:hypothetical protein n=1 Tax=Undibacterium sp. FT79W TaxID=2762296 RepID=UPI00164C3780|nr:hypothetical protein [Undibacterium sp. FT79W]MBC3878772.1 hypothetical protein [Undibacterium sp. FT79W]
MKISSYIPSLHEVVKEGIIVLAGTLLAAYVISRVPAVKALVEGNTLTVKDDKGTVIY